MIEEISGKTSVRCDNCSEPLIKDQDIDGENIRATFPGAKGKNVDRDFCNYNCLRIFLNHKEKLARKAKAAEFSNGVWNIDFTPIEFTQSKLWA